MSTSVHMLKWALNTPLLMGMHNAHQNGAWKGIDDVIFFGVTAASVDYTSGTHRDFDMLVSMFNANIEMMYSENDAKEEELTTIGTLKKDYTLYETTLVLFLSLFF